MAHYLHIFTRGDGGLTKEAVMKLERILRYGAMFVMVLSLGMLGAACHGGGSGQVQDLGVTGENAAPADGAQIDIASGTEVADEDIVATDDPLEGTPAGPGPVADSGEGAEETAPSTPRFSFPYIFRRPASKQSGTPTTETTVEVVQASPQDQFKNAVSKSIDSFHVRYAKLLNPAINDPLCSALPPQYGNCIDLEGLFTPYTRYYSVLAGTTGKVTEIEKFARNKILQMAFDRLVLNDSAYGVLTRGLHTQCTLSGDDGENDHLGDSGRCIYHFDYFDTQVFGKREKDGEAPCKRRVKERDQYGNPLWDAGGAHYKRISVDRPNTCNDCLNVLEKGNAECGLNGTFQGMWGSSAKKWTFGEVADSGIYKDIENKNVRIYPRDNLRESLNIFALDAVEDMRIGVANIDAAFLNNIRGKIEMSGVSSTLRTLWRELNAFEPQSTSDLAKASACLGTMKDGWAPNHKSYLWQNALKIITMKFFGGLYSTDPRYTEDLRNAKTMVKDEFYKNYLRSVDVSCIISSVSNSSAFYDPAVNDILYNNASIVSGSATHGHVFLLAWSKFLDGFIDELAALVAPPAAPAAQSGGAGQPPAANPDDITRRSGTMDR